MGSAVKIGFGVAVAAGLLFVGQALAQRAGTRSPGLSESAEPSAEYVRMMNLGKAHLENRNAAKAIEVLIHAVKLAPKSAPAWRNLARAYRLARQHEPALEALTHARQLEPDSVAVSYLTGLVFANTTRFEDALPHFEQAARLDPVTAALRFQLAKNYQLTDRHDKAVRQLRETVRLDPLHASAHFKLAAYARKARDQEEAKRRTREFLRLRKLFGDETRSADMLERCLYTLAEPPKIETSPDRGKRTPAINVRFVDVTDDVFAAVADAAATAAAVLDVDDAGRCTLFVAEADGGFSLVKRPPGGVFQATAIDLAGSPHPTEKAIFTSCVIGNFHDDVPEGVRYDPKVHALNDVLLNGPGGVRLLKRAGPTAFGDVTESAGLAGITALRARWVDYEHDGDLDLLFARKTGLELWQNNGDGRFEDVTSRVGLLETKGATDVWAADLDASVAVDVIVARDKSPTLVFENQRAGLFSAMPEPPGPWPSARRVLANDLDNDGYPDAVLIGSEEAVVLYGRTARRQRIDLSDMQVLAATLLDYDNDGWLDFCAVGARRDSRTNDSVVGARKDSRTSGAGELGAGGKDGVVRLYRNIGGNGFANTEASTGLSAMRLPAVVDLVAADLDVDGDTDLLLLVAGGRMRLLRNDGGNVNGQLKVRLVTIKTNASGIGTHIELRGGGFWVTRWVDALPIEIGLGGHERFDSVQTLWSNGVVDNQIDVSLARRLEAGATPPLTIVEKNVATGSCPFLYAWDGKGFHFVTDILGNAPLGLPIRRGVMLPADPEEIVLIGEAATFPSRDGMYTVRITSEFCEVLYLDSARLIAVDHPPRVEVHPTDKLMPEPFPPSELWAVESPAELIRAAGDDGIDRTEALRSVDGVFAPPGLELPAPFRGMCHPVSVTLDFGPIDTQRPLVLALSGWLRYGQASTNIALSQSPAHEVIPPMLEVETPGGWQPVDVTVGMPAGKTKTILCDLSGKLPSGARRLRLTTTFEIRWDRIALFERKPLPREHTHELSPKSADLQWRGFSDIRPRAPGHPDTPDYDLATDHPPWRTVLEGWCTRYGDVLELTEDRDDKLVVANAGDALTLRFDPQELGPIPDGLARTFFFYSFGWEKDCDPNVTGGDCVEPLPVPPEPDDATDLIDETDWRVRYNTRYVPRNRFSRERRGRGSR